MKKLLLFAAAMCCMLTASAANWPIQILGNQISDNYTTVEGITVTKEEGNAYRVTIPANKSRNQLLTTSQHVIAYNGDGDLQVVFSGQDCRHIVAGGCFIMDYSNTTHDIYIMGYDEDGHQITTDAIIETGNIGIHAANCNNLFINNFNEFRLLSQEYGISECKTLYPMNLNLSEISGINGALIGGNHVVPTGEVKMYDDQWNELNSVFVTNTKSTYEIVYADATRYEGNEMYFSSYKENDRINKYSNFYGLVVNGKWVNMLNYNHVLGFGDNRIRAIDHYEAWNNNICLEMEGGTYDLKDGICYDSYEDKKITIKLLDDVTLNISEGRVGIHKLHGGGDIKIRSTDTWGGILTINMLNPNNHGSLEDGVRVFTDFKTTSNAPLRNGARLANIENRPIVCEFHVPHTNFYLVDTTLQAYSMDGEKLHLEGDYNRYWADSNHKIVCDGFLTNKNIDFVQLKIAGITVTNLNRKDVLGDGSVKVSYEYSESLREMATYVHLYGDKLYGYGQYSEPFIDCEGNLIVVSHGHVALYGENTFLRHHDGHYCELTGDLMTLCEYEKPFLLGADYSTSINMKYLRWYPRDSKNNNTAVAFTALRHGSETEETIFFGGTSENSLRFTIEGKPSANVKFESTSALGIYDLKSNNPLEYYDGQMWVVNEVNGSRISPATGAAIRVKKKSYGIVLGGTEVITEDEQFKQIPVGNGTAKYDPTYNELTLNNVDIDCTNACGIEVLLGAAKEDLTICLNGKNTIHATGKGVSGIRVPGRLTFTGTGTLYVSASDGKAGIEAQEVILKTSGTNTGCNIRSHGAEYGVYTNSNLRVDNYCRLVAGCTNVNQGTAAIRTPTATLGSNVSMTYNSQPCHVDNAKTAVVDNQSRIVRGDVVVGLTEFNIWVCGTAVTMNNMNNVRGDGTVSYDPAENVLTLKGANLPAVTDHMSRRSTIWSYGSLTVKIEGTNTLNAGIRTGGHLTLTGREYDESDSLCIHVESNDSWNAIQCYGLTIEDCKLEAVQPGTGSYAASYVISSGSQMPVVLRDCWLNVRNAKSSNGRAFERYEMEYYNVDGIVVDEGDIAGRTATFVAHPAERSYYSIIASPQSMGSVFGYVNSNETHCTWEDMSYGYKGIETYIGTNIVVKAEPRDGSVKFEGWWLEGSSMLVSTDPELHLTCDLPYVSLVARFAPAEEEVDLSEGINDIVQDVVITKTLVNGQVVIQRGEMMFDIMGRRLK